jgi:lipoprotein-anchoring transpeptidase ErfK/SrfK
MAPDSVNAAPVAPAPAFPVATGVPPSGSAGLRNARLAAKVGAHVRLRGAELREAVAAEPALPLAFDDVPGVLRAQILLDAARFSPGIIDGWWGENLRFAVRAFQKSEGLPVADTLDAATFARLVKRTGAREPLVRYTLSAADVKGPFRKLPDSIYEKAKLPCLCYTSLLEQLAERFHTSTVVLQRLNPGVDFAKLAAGAKVVVPNVARAALPGPTARLVIDKGEGSLRGLDAKGRTLFWLPTSLGADDEPSPTGRLTVTGIARNPQYHYNPLVLGDVDDSAKAAYLPAGPNSPVGVLWMQLSKKHVGIHGTPDPETIGPLASHGCVRLTNWDATYLSALAKVGMPVEFR